MAAATATAAVAKDKPPLDDIMLAMDVVDTLRRSQRLIERELSEADRAEALKERLRRIYAAQGIEVSDAILEEGVQALKQDRFVYRPPPDSLAVRLARVYVTRERWGKWVLGGLAALAVGIVAWLALVAGPRSALPGDLEAMHAAVVELAREPAVDAKADALLQMAEQALRDDQPGRARDALDELRALRNRLEASYRLVVVNAPGARSGVFRIPDDHPAARNYYLIVEAIGPDGRKVQVPITSEETGKTKRTPTWGLRVDQATYDRVAADKRDDGIIQANILGHKRPGELEPDYSVPTTGAAITDW